MVTHSDVSAGASRPLAAAASAEGAASAESRPAACTTRGATSHEPDHPTASADGHHRRSPNQGAAGTVNAARLQFSRPSPPDPAGAHDAETLTARELLLADAIAERIAGLLRDEDASAEHRLVSAAEVARELNVGRQWVYEHAEELGARRLGDGPRARLRFDLETVRVASVCLISKRSNGQDASPGAKSEDAPKRRGRRLPNRLPEPGSILAVRPRNT